MVAVKCLELIELGAQAPDPPVQHHGVDQEGQDQQRNNDGGCVLAHEITQTL